MPDDTTTTTTTTTTIEPDDVEAPTEPTETVAPDEPTTAWTQTAPWPSARELRHEARRARRRARPRAFLGPLTVSILLLGAGVAGLLQALNVLEVNLTVLLALGTMVIGAALIVSTWIGRARGLIALGLLFVMATAISATLDIPLRGGAGNVTYQPLTVSQLQRSYSLSAGRMRLDLNNMDTSGLPSGTTVVDATVGLGQLHVNVPHTVRVLIDAHVGAGEINLFDTVTSGWRVDDSADYGQAMAADNPPTLLLRLHVGAGYLVVNS